MTLSRRLALLALLSLLFMSPVDAGEPLKPVGKPPTPRFNRLYDTDAVGKLLQAYARAYPRWLRLSTIGQSIEGRPIWLLTLTNPESGPELQKPAMYVDANTHANEDHGALGSGGVLLRPRREPRRALQVV